MAAAAEQPFGPGLFAPMAAASLVYVPTYIFLVLPCPAGKQPTARPRGTASRGPLFLSGIKGVIALHAMQHEKHHDRSDRETEPLQRVRTVPRGGHHVRRPTADVGAVRVGVGQQYM